MSDNHFNVKSTAIQDVKSQVLSLGGSIYILKKSVDDATCKMSSRYGDGHHITNRLRSYYSAIDKAVGYLDELNCLLDLGRLSETHLLIEKIRAISEMIRLDAANILVLMSGGKDPTFDGERWN